MARFGVVVDKKPGDMTYNDVKEFGRDRFGRRVAVSYWPGQQAHCIKMWGGVDGNARIERLVTDADLESAVDAESIIRVTLEGMDHELTAEETMELEHLNAWKD